MSRVTGALLNDQWHVGALHALYHHGGCWYQVLKRFPGALFDPRGYVLFESRAHFESCSFLTIRKKTHVRGSIADIPEYVRVVPY